MAKAKKKKGKVPTGQDYSKVYVPSPITGEKGNLADLVRKYNSDVMDDVVSDIDGTSGNVAFSKADESKMVDRTKPRMVDHVEFFNNAWKYQKQELVYYAKDDVLTTSEGIPLAEPDKIVGIDALVSGVSGKFVYVVNETLLGLYSIQHLDENFYKERDVRTRRRHPSIQQEEEE